MNHRAAGPLPPPMLRLLLLTAAALALAAPASAAPQQPADRLVLLVNDPGGRPVAGALGHVECEPPHELPALRGAGLQRTGLPALAPAPELLDGISNEHGVLRIRDPVGGAAGRAGAAIVRTDAGLGALVPRLLAGRAQRVVLQPMAAVRTANDSEVFTLHARAHFQDGRTLTLPPLRGTEVRLPEGSYEIWGHAGDAWVWQRLDLASGQRAELRLDGPAQRLVQAPRSTVFPTGRPDVPLFGATAEATLRGAALAAPLSAFQDGWLLGPHVLPGPPRAEPIPWPDAAPPASEFTRRCEPLADAGAPVLCSLVRTEADTWRVVGAHAAAGGRAEGGFPVAQTLAGDAWLLLLAEGCAPKAAPWSDRHDPGFPNLQRGVPLVVHARDEAGLPAVDLVVDYTPDGMDPARVLGRTDARGTARLGPVLGPGRLRVSDERFANQELALAAVPLAGVQLTAAAGAELTGKAVDPEGRPLAAALVTLRDPSGRLRPASRSMTTTGDGAFRFTGLAEDQDLVLFVTTTRDARTWSGRSSRARAGGGPIEVTVRSEDPALDAPRGR